MTDATPLTMTNVQPSDGAGNRSIDLSSNNQVAHAQHALDTAPPINSLPSHCGYNLTNTDNIQNEGLPTAGSRSLSTATALLHQSLDSGSLTGNLPKNGQNQMNPISNHNTSFSPHASIGNNIQLSSASTTTSGEDNSKQAMCVCLEKKSRPESEPASSYMEMTARTNINQRLEDFNSSMTIADKKAALPMPNNDLDQSIQGAQGPARKTSLPKNIPDPNQSLSINRDDSMTLPKSISCKSTQTDPTGQDQDRYGGAAAAGTPDQSMSSGPASSLPSDDVLVRKLKRPIIQWLQRKLETNIGMAWQDLVDLHDWDYERITDFESSCAGKSPFCLLLAEPEFQMYRISDLKRDLEKLPRIDILYDLDDVMKRHYK